MVLAAVTNHTAVPPAAESAPPLDIAAVRRQFPILGRLIDGLPLVYLDSAASSQQPEAVIEAVDTYVRRSHANVHRGVHTLSEEATAQYEGARADVARFVGAREAAEIIFTSGTTESINLVAGSWGAANLGPGDAVLLTAMEHHSNIVPWQLLAERTGVQLHYLGVTDDGQLDTTNLARYLESGVRLVSLVHVSNVLGVTNPIAKIVEAAHSAGALVLLDAAQSMPHVHVDVTALGVDFMAFSGHKMGGPTGIGALWAKRELLEAMPPWQGGGEMISRVTLEGSRYADVPAKFEAGTPPIAQAIGLGAAARWLAELGPAVAAHDAALAGAAHDRLAKAPGVTVYGPREGRTAVVAFTVEGVHPHDLATILDGRGIAVRAGHHCTMPLHHALGLRATARASFWVYNDEDDIAALQEGIAYARDLFGNKHLA